jgi:histidine ammonia-lyase
MSALVMENRHLAAPGSVDSVPGKSNAEDHV